MSKIDSDWYNHQINIVNKRNIELEEALHLIGECTSCPLCRNRALDALAGGASKRNKVKLCAHEPLLELDGKPIKGSKRCKHCGLNESYWSIGKL